MPGGAAIHSVSLGGRRSISVRFDQVSGTDSIALSRWLLAMHQRCTVVIRSSLCGLGSMFLALIRKVCVCEEVPSRRSLDCVIPCHVIGVAPSVASVIWNVFVTGRQSDGFCSSIRPRMLPGQPLSRGMSPSPSLLQPGHDLFFQCRLWDHVLPFQWLSVERVMWIAQQMPHNGGAVHDFPTRW